LITFSIYALGCVLILIASILGAIFNPKRDLDGMNAALKEYYSDANAGRPMELNGDVEVVNTNPKKSKDKKIKH